VSPCALPSPSSPVATVDDSLPFILNILLANVASLAGVAAVLCFTQVPAAAPSFLFPASKLGGAGRKGSLVWGSRTRCSGLHRGSAAC
jgi:hypothetical protein